MIEALYHRHVTLLTYNSALCSSIRVSLSIGIGDTFFDGVSLSVWAILLCASISIGDTIFDGIDIDYCHTFTEYS